MQIQTLYLGKNSASYFVFTLYSLAVICDL